MMRRKQRGFLLNPFRFGGFNFNEVVLQLHGDGTNGSTTITDSSVNNLTCTAYGDAQVSTAQKKFGSGSLKFDGSGDYIDAADSALFAMNTDFTIECWLYVDPTTPAWGRVFENAPYDSGVVTGFHTRFYGSDGAGVMRIGFQLTNFGGGGAMMESDAAFPVSAWTHYAVVRASGVFAQYVGGVRQASTISSSASFTSQKMRLGSPINLGSEWYKGYIDEFRVTRGRALYNADFTPPTAAFPDA